MRVDPPWPSFSFVMNRLPAYRQAHLGRFHPYARVTRRRLEDAFMVLDANLTSNTSPDNLHEDSATQTNEPLPPPPLLRPTELRPVDVESAHPDNDVSNFELDPSVPSPSPTSTPTSEGLAATPEDVAEHHPPAAAEDGDTPHEHGPEPQLGRGKLVVALDELLRVLRRQLAILKPRWLK
ncbi:hypothetical protein C8Q76DRAFT_397987 [Earliella scabrosa]|nr:hypothetical protein C8Q76DRAFT_397987 [Earliella scabrosa]